MILFLLVGPAFANRYRSLRWADWGEDPRAGPILAETLHPDLIQYLACSLNSFEDGIAESSVSRVAPL